MSLLSKVEKFLTESGMPWTKFGRLVARDPRLVGDMRRGREPRRPLIEKIETFIRDNSK